MFVFLGIVVGLLYLLGLAALFGKCMDATIDEPWSRAAWGWGVAVILAIAIPASVAVSASGWDDPNANRLCERGHQEWRTRRRSPALVGKVIVPGGSYETKVWICEQWAR